MLRRMEDRWMYHEGKRSRRPYMAGMRIPFDPARWPEYDHHVEMRIDYGAHWRTGLPKPKELGRLQDLEDSMIAKLEGHGALVATETSDAVRTIHLFIRGGGPLLETYRKHESAGTQGHLAVTVAHDPQWRRVAHLSEVASRAA
jgi:hypothetical protein